MAYDVTLNAIPYLDYTMTMIRKPLTLNSFTNLLGDDFSQKFLPPEDVQTTEDNQSVNDALKPVELVNGQVRKDEYCWDYVYSK